MIKKKKKVLSVCGLPYQQLSTITEMKLFELSSYFGIVLFEVGKLRHATARQSLQPFHPVVKTHPIHCFSSSLSMLIVLCIILPFTT